MYTEEEAAKKQCPHVTYCVNEDQVNQYNHNALMVQSPCIGSDCMAWRWESKTGFCGLSGLS